jgi:hypothetical protein
MKEGRGVKTPALSLSTLILGSAQRYHPYLPNAKSLVQAVLVGTPIDPEPASEPVEVPEAPGHQDGGKADLP